MGWSVVGTVAIGTAPPGSPGQPGQHGQDGANWLMGSGPPSNQQGRVGDFYFQNQPPGATGPILLQGPPGDKGRPGETIIVQAGSALLDRLALIPPKLTDWTLSTTTSGTLTAADRSVVLYGPATSTDAWSMALKTIPATPYSCIFHIQNYMPAINNSAYGVVWRDSATGKVKSIGIVFNSSFGTPCYVLEVGAGTDGTAHITSDYTTSVASELPKWFRLRDDSTTEYFEVSADGVTWVTVFSQARNSTFTANQVGFWVSPRNIISMPAYVALWSYTETKP